MTSSATISQRGIRKPRFLCDVSGKPLFARAISGYRVTDRIYIIVRRADYNRYSLDVEIAKYIKAQVHILLVDGKPSEESLTLIENSQFINNDDPLMILSPNFINDCDLHKVRIDAENYEIPALGSIVVSKKIMCGNCEYYVDFSSVSTNDMKYVKREKTELSVGVAGIYYWNYGFQFVQMAQQITSIQNNYKGKYHLAPIFNRAISNDMKIAVHTVEKSWVIQSAKHAFQFSSDFEN